MSKSKFDQFYNLQIAASVNCLLIDDDPDDQEIFCLALREINPEIQCMLARDGREGLKKLKLLEGHAHDYIFIDLNMPGFGGIETMKEIRKLPNLSNAKLIIYSTSSLAAVIDSALTQGAFRYLVKPSSVEGLKFELRKIFAA